MNLGIIIGNLTRDPEMKFTASGQPMTAFDVAINRTRKGPDGNTIKETEYIPVKAWGKTAELCDQYLSKGKKVCCQGRMSIRSYEDKEGNKRKHFELIADKVEFLSPKEG